MRLFDFRRRRGPVVNPPPKLSGPPLMQGRVCRPAEVHVELVDGQWRVVDADGRVIATHPYRGSP